MFNHVPPYSLMYNLPSPDGVYPEVRATRGGKGDMTSLTAVTLNKIGLELEVDQLIVTKYCIGGTHRNSLMAVQLLNWNYRL